MTESKHTPGPWIARAFGTPTLCVTDADAAYVVDRFKLGGRSQAEHDANASLIAASPNLLAACESSLRLLQARLDFAEILDEEKAHIDTLRAAIAKAKGA